MAWVIGHHGLLGSALVRTMPADTVVYRVPFRFQWNDTAALEVQLTQAVAGFALAAETAAGWSVYWAAGVGTMQSDSGALAIETAALRLLLNLLEANPALRLCPGRFAFASSAGALYAGSRDLLISEESQVAPTTSYASAKLQQEASVLAYSARNSNVASLVARFSTLYGRGQATGKPQGLLTQISRQVIRGLPVRIYVSLDTIRDYLEVDDAARALTVCHRGVATGSALMKIIASERPTTISEIVAVFRRVSRRPPKIITSASRASTLYTRRIQFRSSLRPNLLPVYQTSLVVGVAGLLEAERLRYAMAV